jgi:hypothetical protein
LHPFLKRSDICPHPRSEEIVTECEGEEKKKQPQEEREPTQWSKSRVDEKGQITRRREENIASSLQCPGWSVWGLPFWVQSESVVLSFLDLLEKLKYRSL